MKRLTRILLATFVAFGLSACGGGGSSSAVTGAQIKSGVYGGTWTDSDGSSKKVFIMVSGNKLYGSADTGSGADARFKLDASLKGNVVTAKGKVYEGTKSVDVKAHGTLKGDTLNMAIAPSGLEEIKMTVKRLPYSDDASSFDLMQGHYTEIAQKADISLNAKGALSGSNTVTGCKYSGDIDIINPKVNLYALTLKISKCPDAGNYTGLLVRDTGGIIGLFDNESKLSGFELTK